MNINKRNWCRRRFYSILWRLFNARRCLFSLSLDKPARRCLGLLHRCWLSWRTFAFTKGEQTSLLISFSSRKQVFNSPAVYHNCFWADQFLIWCRCLKFFVDHSNLLWNQPEERRNSPARQQRVSTFNKTPPWQHWLKSVFIANIANHEANSAINFGRVRTKKTNKFLIRRSIDTISDFFCLIIFVVVSLSIVFTHVSSTFDVSRSLEMSSEDGFWNSCLDEPRSKLRSTLFSQQNSSYYCHKIICICTQNFPRGSYSKYFRKLLIFSEVKYRNIFNSNGIWSPTFVKNQTNLLS